MHIISSHLVTTIMSTSRTYVLQNYSGSGRKNGYAEFVNPDLKTIKKQKTKQTSTDDMGVTIVSDI